MRWTERSSAHILIGAMTQGDTDFAVRISAGVFICPYRFNKNLSPQSNFLIVPSGHSRNNGGEGGPVVLSDHVYLMRKHRREKGPGQHRTTSSPSAVVGSEEDRDGVGALDLE